MQNLTESELIDRALMEARDAGLPEPTVVEFGGRLRFKCPGQGSGPGKGCHRILLPGLNGYNRHFLAAHRGVYMGGGLTGTGDKKRSMFETGDRNLPVEKTRAWARQAADSRRRISERFSK